MRGRVALVFPRTRYQTGDPPLGIAYLAAVLRRERPELDVRIIDATFLGGERRLLRAVHAAGADLVGVFADSLMLPQAWAVAREARAAGAFTLAGGPAASVEPERLVPPFDAALVGEGELQIAAIVDRVLEHAPMDDLPNLVLRGDGDQTVATESRPCPPTLDDLPLPAWDLLDMKRYVRLWPYLDSVRIDTRGTNVVGSRGCPWRCTYCQPTLSAVFGRRVRRRSPESLAEEIVTLRRRYGVEGVFFHDDTLTANERWVMALCDALARVPGRISWGCNSRVDVLTPELVDAMVDAGMRSVHLGIEAGSARVRRDVLDKHVDLDHLATILERLRRRGAHALGFFMLGAPSETFREMLSTLRLARRLPLTEATFSITTALPGTRLHDRTAADPRFVLREGPSADYYNDRNFDDLESAVGTRTIRALQLAGLAGFYLHPHRAGYLARHFTSPGGLKKLAMKSARFLRLRKP